MKKCLLLLTVVMLNIIVTQAQNEGYSWTFGSAPPFNSVPAITGSAGSYTLTLLGDGAAAITTASENPGLGTSCTAPIGITNYSLPTFQFGVEFTNAPQIVSNIYTIEITFKFAPTGGFHRLMGFTDLGTAPDNDYGVYIDPAGDILFYSASQLPNGLYIGGASLAPDTWYQLTFVRDASNSIRYYQNGVFQAAYDDAALEFLPQAASANVINFLKDDGTEEVDGSIAKLSIYNRTLTESEIINRTFNNVCNTTDLLPPDPREGYQWTFAGAPFNSTPALSQSTGSFELNNLGAAITTGTTDDPDIGTSCAVPVVAAPIAAYPAASGLEFANVPRYVYDVYTIEMAVNITSLGANFVRLAGFNDLSAPPASDYGIYVNLAGHVDFVTAGGNNPIAAAPLTTNTWYHLVFTRDAAGLISYYQNGALVGTYNDVADDFVPKAGIGYVISLFKDDVGDESAGELVKVGIFNVALLAQDVQERFDNICNAALVILPVSLKNFTAVKVDKQVQLTWTTATEDNNLGFEVQRSNDGVSYTTIGFVRGYGTSTQDITYNFTDIAPLGGNNYYRLKQIDINNIAKFSSIRRINMDKLQQDIHLFPNPARDIITITNIKAGDQLSIFNAHGNLVHRKIASSGQESITVDKLASGVYMLHVTDKENNKRVIRFTRF